MIYTFIRLYLLDPAVREKLLGMHLSVRQREAIELVWSAVQESPIRHSQTVRRLDPSPISLDSPPHGSLPDDDGEHSIVDSRVRRWSSRGGGQPRWGSLGHFSSSLSMSQPSEGEDSAPDGLDSPYESSLDGEYGATEEADGGQSGDEGDVSDGCGQCIQRSVDEDKGMSL